MKVEKTLLNKRDKLLSRLPIVSHTDHLPSGLMTALQLSEALLKKGIGVGHDRISELAECYFIPHYRVDGGEPRFLFSESRQWIAKNLTQRIDGQSISVEYRILAEAGPGAALGTVPACLSMLADRLISVPRMTIVSGVYFLCRGMRVVYVGQSICSGARIANHAQSGRLFDYAFVLPVPASELGAVEGAFIRLLSPEDNRAEGYLGSDPDSHVLGRVGFGPCLAESLATNTEADDSERVA